MTDWAFRTLITTAATAAGGTVGAIVTAAFTF